MKVITLTACFFKDFHKGNFFFFKLLMRGEECSDYEFRLLPLR